MHIRITELLWLSYRDFGIIKIGFRSILGFRCFEAPVDCGTLFIFARDVIC